MQITLKEPQLSWRPIDAKTSRGKAIQPTDTVVTVLVPGAATPTPLPCTIHVPADYDARQTFLEQEVQFAVMHNSRKVAERCLHVKDCLPILEDGTLCWTAQPVTFDDKQPGELTIAINTVTDRRARPVLRQAMVYQSHAKQLARQLSLHRNTVVLSLLPPVLGCFVGIVATAPIWVPVTMFIGILGFPVWFVVGVAMALVTSFSVISAIVTVRLVRSERARLAIQRLCQSPGGELLLFQSTEGSTQAELLDRARQYVMEDPSRKLMASLAIDALGNATFVVPFLGEAADLFWAPVSATLVSTLYAESSPNVKYVAFLEEVLPFTDFIPTATLAWLKEILTTKQPSS